MNYDYFVEPGEFIAHHGVKGQKWGIRRKKYTPVKVPKFSKDPIGYGVAKAKNFAFKDVKDATPGEKALAVALGLGLGGAVATNIYAAKRIAAARASFAIRSAEAQARINAGRAAMDAAQASIPSSYELATRNALYGTNSAAYRRLTT